jgi:hypothetical protein
MDAALAIRLLVACACVVAPTLLFLGLWRGLIRMRDDDLVNRLLNDDSAGFEVDPVRIAPFAPGSSGPVTDRDREGPAPAAVRCPACNAETASDVRYCADCLVRLER